MFPFVSSSCRGKSASLSILSIAVKSGPNSNWSWSISQPFQLHGSKVWPPPGFTHYPNININPWLGSDCPLISVWAFCSGWQCLHSSLLQSAVMMVVARRSLESIHSIGNFQAFLRRKWGLRTIFYMAASSWGIFYLLFCEIDDKSMIFTILPALLTFPLWRFWVIQVISELKVKVKVEVAGKVVEEGFFSSSVALIQALLPSNALFSCVLLNKMHITSRNDWQWASSRCLGAFNSSDCALHWLFCTFSFVWGPQQLF